MKIADESNVDRGAHTENVADAFNQKYRDQFVSLAEKCVMIQEAGENIRMKLWL